MSIPASATFSLQYSIFGNRNLNQPCQIVKIRLGHCSQLIFGSPSAGIPHQILQQTPSTPMGEGLFPFSEVLVMEFLLSFNIFPASVCEDVFERIADFAQQLGGGDSNGGFEIEANIDYVKFFWMEAMSIAEETVVVEEAQRGAPEWAIERLTNEKFDGLEEKGDCSVCCDELENNGKKEVRRMPCGHVFHKTCILTWLRRSNSCPLCRHNLQ